MDSFSIKQYIEEELSALLGYSISEILPVITKNSTTVPNELTASTSQITEIKHPSLTKRPLQLSTLATESHPKSNLVGKVESQIHTMFSSPITTKNFSESAIAITTTPSTMITSQPSMQPSLSEIKTQPATYNVKSTPSKIYCFPTAIIPLPETSPSSTYLLPKSNVIQHLTVETKIIPKSPITESKVEPTNFHIKEPPLSKNKTDYFNKSSLASPTGNLAPRPKFSTVCPLANTSTKKDSELNFKDPYTNQLNQISLFYNDRAQNAGLIPETIYSTNYALSPYINTKIFLSNSNCKTIKIPPTNPGKLNQSKSIYLLAPRISRNQPPNPNGLHI
jgi:hypothetical protein